MPLIIAIDGYSSCGKSTLARQLADELNYIFIDTGAMYRAITLYFQRKDLSLQQPEDQLIQNTLREIRLSFEFNSDTQKNEIYLNGENVEKLIREPEVAGMVSEVAALKAVRDFAVAQQRLMGEKGGVVMDGRDIGTTVFPEADLKIFMTASIAVRVNRRYLEMKLTHPGISLEEVKENLEKRDYLDTHRKESPLRQAKDALVLDNSELNREEQLAIALKWVSQAKEKKG